MCRIQQELSCKIQEKKAAEIQQDKDTDTDTSPDESAEAEGTSAEERSSGDLGAEEFCPCGRESVGTECTRSTSWTVAENVKPACKPALCSCDICCLMLLHNVWSFCNVFTMRLEIRAWCSVVTCVVCFISVILICFGLWAGNTSNGLHAWSVFYLRAECFFPKRC